MAGKKKETKVLFGKRCKLYKIDKKKKCVNWDYKGRRRRGW